jgi:hypothetical protein
VLSGELRGHDGDSPVIGVYLNDGTEAKVGYYLDLEVTAQAAVCRADGSQVVDARITLTSTAPADAASLPSYLVGNGRIVPPGEIRTNLTVYMPLGGGYSAVRVNSEPAGLLAQRHGGLAVGGRTITLKPGESETLDLKIITGEGQSGPLRIRSTPTARQSGAQNMHSACNAL